MGINTREIATAASFSVFYALLKFVPISPLIGVQGFLTLGDAFAPLGGMLLGFPIGPLSVAGGTFLTFGLGRPIVFDGLDFIPGTISALIASLCSTGRATWAIFSSIALLALFTLDPISPKLIQVGQFGVPYLWMHVISLIVFVGIVRVKKAEFVADKFLVPAIVFLSLMDAHVAGGIMYENVLVRINRVVDASTIALYFKGIFFVYPVERVFLTVLGSVVSASTLRALGRKIGVYAKSRTIMPS